MGTSSVGSRGQAAGHPAAVADLARAGFVDAVEVGRAAAGVVFRATHEAAGRVVAVTLLHTDLDRVGRERFLREGRALGGLSGHPNVVDVLQVGVTPSGRPYLVMPFRSPDSLAARVRRDGPVPWQEATRIGVRLAGGLESAHRVGTLHRDVEPTTILLADDGEAQLTDFRIARTEGRLETATGAFTGSLAHTAPELLTGRPPTAASDVYGLGAALFSIIAGHAAFERRPGEEIIAQLLRILHDPVPDLRGHGVPDELCAVLEQAMAKDPAERPSTAEELGRLLQGVQRAADLAVAEMAVTVGRQQECTGSAVACAAPEAARADPLPDEDVQFTVFRPRTVEPGLWQELLVYAHLSVPFVGPDGHLHDPDQIVRERARHRLGPQASWYGFVAGDSGAGLPRGDELRFVPRLDGARFNPPQAFLRWEEPVHDLTFRFRVGAAEPGCYLHGGLDVYLGIVLISTVPFSVRVGPAAAAPLHQEPEPRTVSPFRNVFASYSHRDEAIVRHLRTIVEATGDRFLMDVHDLRAGQRWQPALAEMITDADVFQLFWSHDAMRSPYVRAEWEHAVGLRRRHFVRPVYWQDPLPSDRSLGLPPPSLAQLHFGRLHAIASLRSGAAAAREPARAAQPGSAATGAIAVPDVASPPAPPAPPAQAAPPGRAAPSAGQPTPPPVRPPAARSPGYAPPPGQAPFGPGPPSGHAPLPRSAPRPPAARRSAARRSAPRRATTVAIAVAAALVIAFGVALLLGWI